ncbi:MAG TPA: ATP-binding cassette domain-containing protein [Candidatus Saccharimonadales bacterium]|nr:ATP-binding cassette domain-containing protein [Candidatus Saccharimonadales bacterium]
MIKAQHLSKQYRRKLAVSDLSFELQPGKVTGFLGPNGAGKSTTMRLMLGLDNGVGKTTYDGKPLHEYAQPSKLVGVLLEAKAFHPTRSARQHLRVLAAAGGVSMSRVDEALEIVGLQNVAKKGPGKFSLGMSQRLGIAAAILGEPKYLMLDEPANGLDPEGVAWLRQFLKDYANQGKGVFVSSHLLSEMELMAEQVVVIGKGKLIADTSMQELTSGSKHTGVFVRATQLAKLEAALKQAKIDFQKADGGLKIAGSKTDAIGKLAFDAGVPLLELANRSASLEEVFLELTEGSEEYGSHTKGDKK